MPAALAAALMLAAAASISAHPSGVGTGVNADAPPVAQAPALGDPTVVLGALRATGDIAHIVEARQALGQVARIVVQEENPAALAKLEPPLQAYLATPTIEASLGRELDRFLRPEVVAGAQTLAGSPELGAVHAALREHRANPAVPPLALSPARRALLKEFALAQLFGVELAKRTMVPMEMHARLTDAVVPDSIRFQQLYPVPPTMPRLDIVVDAYLGPALEGHSDEAVRRYVAFADSAAGRAVRNAIKVLLSTHRNSPWHDGLVGLVQAHARREPSAAGAVDVAALLRETRARLRVNDVDGLRERLLEAQRAAPRNADIAYHLGEIALLMRGGRQEAFEPRAAHQTSAGNFTEADQRLLQAIELDPGHAPALATHARSLFFQHRDAEAREFLDRARKADPSFDLLPFYDGALLQVEGRAAEAVARYREILSREEAFPNMHLHVLLTGQPAWLAAGEAADYTRRMSAYVAENPRQDLARYRLALHLHQAGALEAEVMRVLEPLPAGPLKERLAASVQGAASAAAIDSNADPATVARGLVRAGSAPGGIAAMVMSTCRDRDHIEQAVVLAEASGDAEALQRAVGCAVLLKQPQYIARLAKSGADLDAPKVLDDAMSPLAVAIRVTRDPAMVQALLEAGASALGTDGRPLREKVSGGHSDTDRQILALLDAADPTTVEDDRRLRSAHSVASVAQGGDIVVQIDAICAGGVDREQLIALADFVARGGATPAQATKLFGCSLQYRDPPIELLAKGGADLDTRELPGRGVTALTRAAENDDVAMFQRLLAAGADPAAATGSEQTLHELLVYRNTPQTAEMLRLMQARSPN